MIQDSARWLRNGIYLLHIPIFLVITIILLLQVPPLLLWSSISCSEVVLPVSAALVGAGAFVMHIWHSVARAGIFWWAFDTLCSIKLYGETFAGASGSAYTAVNYRISWARLLRIDIVWVAASGYRVHVMPTHASVRSSGPLVDLIHFWLIYFGPLLVCLQHTPATIVLLVQLILLVLDVTFIVTGRSFRLLRLWWGMNGFVDLPVRSQMDDVVRMCRLLGSLLEHAQTVLVLLLASRLFSIYFAGNCLARLLFGRSHTQIFLTQLVIARATAGTVDLVTMSLILSGPPVYSHLCVWVQLLNCDLSLWTERILISCHVPSWSRMLVILNLICNLLISLCFF